MREQQMLQSGTAAAGSARRPSGDESSETAGEPAAFCALAD